MKLVINKNNNNLRHKDELTEEKEIHKLLVIGNGFDLFHGLQTSFENFKTYLKDNQINLFLKIEKLFGNSFLWANFEDILGESFEKISQIMIKADEEYYHIPFEDDDGDEIRESQTRLMHIRGEIANYIPFPTDIMRGLTKWLDSIEINDDGKNDTIHKTLKSASKIISYNYTKTIEEKYGVNDITHIHGTIDKPDSIKFGHTSLSEAGYTISSHFDGISDSDYFMEFHKYKRITENNFSDEYTHEDLFSTSKIKSISEIVFMGLSFGKQDIISIKEYIKLANFKNCKFIYWSDDDLLNIKRIISEFKISDYSLFHWHDIDDNL